jgi:hypothetical protein
LSSTRWFHAVSFGFLVALFSVNAAAQEQARKLTIRWDKVERVSKTTPTLQVVVNPPLRRGTSVHDNAFRALQDLRADYVRFVPWLPYPKLAVAELDLPQQGKTSWDFSLIDPLVMDFLEATKGHPVVLNFSTIPQWMFKTEKPVPYPADPNQVGWDYEQGQELRDANPQLVAEYYARLLAWYTQGGFTDESGKRQESGHHFTIPIWEVLNEVEAEHQMSPEFYTLIYDAVATAMLRVQPQTKFVGLALAYPGGNPRFFEYFLDRRNHQAGVPLDYISYHFYASPTPGESPEVQQYTFFAQADGFLNVVRYVESIRQRLSPDTRTMINEVGSIRDNDNASSMIGKGPEQIPASYWHLSAAVYAYLYAELARLGIDVVGESQLVGYPTQFPSVSMVDWKTGKPNPRFRVLQLIHDNFGPGDRIVETQMSDPYAYALAVVTPAGQHRLLLINKREQPMGLSVAGAANAQEQFVDMTTGSKPLVSRKLASDKVTLGGFSVAVLTLP